jgi:hypothetical protein
MGDSFPFLVTAATALIDTMALVEPFRRVLRAVLARLESGTLRMPVTDAVRWVDIDLPGEG